MTLCAVSRRRRDVHNNKSQLRTICHEAKGEVRGGHEDYGQEFSFLKRRYVYVEDGLMIKPGQYASNIIKTYVTRATSDLPGNRSCLNPHTQDADGSNLASPEDAAIYRSIVGMGIYLAQERVDVALVDLQVHSRRNLTTESAEVCGISEGDRTSAYPSSSTSERTGEWQPATRKSTSSSVHALHGLIIYSASRGQQVVSLSSAESELHAVPAMAYVSNASSISSWRSGPTCVLG